MNDTPNKEGDWKEVATMKLGFLEIEDFLIVMDVIESLLASHEAKVKKFIQVVEVREKHWTESDEYDKGMGDMRNCILELLDSDLLAQSPQEE